MNAVKIAISVPDGAFEAGEHLAQQLGVSRSRLCSDALAAYLSTRGAQVVTAQLNAVHEAASSNLVPAVESYQIESRPWNVRVGKADSGLAKPSVVNVSQLLTLDRELLAERVRALPADAMPRVDAGLRLALGLP
jgi:mRNA interferase MazF